MEMVLEYRGLILLKRRAIDVLRLTSLMGAIFERNGHANQAFEPLEPALN